MITKSVSGFFHWWGGELAACLPTRLRARFGRTQLRLVIEVSETRARFTYEKGRELHPLGEVSISPTDLANHNGTRQREAVGRIIRGVGARWTKVILRVPREKVLRRLVELPSAAAENLREVLAFEMDRHTPFKTEDVYFDYRLEGSDPERNWIKVDLVVVPRRIADQAMRLAITWGLEPDQLGADDEPEDGARSFNLLPPGANRAQAAFRRRSVAALAVSACAALAIALYMPLKQNQEILAATKAQLAQAQAQAVQADALKKQVEEWLERSRFVVERKRNERTVTALLDELSRLLPNHTWVFEFQVRAGRLSLSGYSAKPSSLIGLLEQSDMLTEVRFSAPVKMNREIGLESFKLTATLTQRGKT